MKLRYFLIKYTADLDVTQLKFTDVSRTVPVFTQIEDDLFLFTRTGIPYHVGKSPNLSCIKEQAIELKDEVVFLSENKHLKHSIYNKTTKRMIGINRKQNTEELEIEEAINFSFADKINRWRLTSVPQRLKVSISLVSKMPSSSVIVESLQDLSARGYEIYDKGILWFVVYNGDVFFLLTCIKSA
jgi:hypothetical protein